MKAWPHQITGLNDLADAILFGHTRILLTSPTGGGKSHMMRLRMDESGKRTAIYTHRKLILAQLAKGLEDHGFDVGVRASGHDQALLRPTQIAMVQSEFNNVFKNKRHELHSAKEFFVDEAHNNRQEQATAIIDGHLDAGAVLIGMTATPLGLGHLYDKLIVAGTNKELRKCGAHVPAYHYGPDEPDKALVGKIAIGQGECGIAQAKRMHFAHRVFGRVIENYHILNPNQTPALLFAPGVQESIWFAEELTKHGIKAAHIDGTNAWIDGEVITKDQDVVDDIAKRSQSGDIKVVCNRFVLREGVDWPWIQHGIFATVFGSLTSYIQAGGRLLRAHPTMDSVTIQDHGGNWWRHGSLNASRTWKLEDTDYIVSHERLAKIREGKEREPISCPQCNTVRMSGPDCPSCGFRYAKKTRRVLQVDGSLREMKNDMFVKRRSAPDTQNIRDDWRWRVVNTRKSQKDTVKNMTFNQLDVRFARDHNFCYAPRGIPFMPKKDSDWFRKVSEVPLEALTL